MADFCKVRLNISSSLCDLDAAGVPDGEGESTSTNADGSMSKQKDGSLTVSYEEESESGKILSDIKITDSKITVRRRGAIESTMVFEEGVIHRSLYTLPPYSMDMQIYTKRIRRNMRFGGGELTLIYEMKIGGTTRSCTMKITAGQ